MAEINLVEAINRALAYEMAHDPSIVLLGEDIGVNGGVFRATIGLQQRFGSERVIDTPVAETAIAGAAIGMAAMGLKPVAEIQFSGFIYPAIDHIINHASRLRHRTRGRLSCPMVLRSPCGAGIHAPEHHSESPEALFTHIPGLRVVVPSSPSRAYGLLLAAIRDPDPVIFLEPTRLYRLFKQEVTDDTWRTARDGAEYEPLHLPLPSSGWLMRILCSIVAPSSAFMASCDSKFRQQIFDVAKAQCEPEIEPDRLLDDLGREAVATIADLGHHRWLHLKSLNGKPTGDVTRPVSQLYST
jgi:hypothetical protein